MDDCYDYEVRHRGDLIAGGWTDWTRIVPVTPDLAKMFESRVFGERPTRITLHASRGKAQIRRVPPEQHFP